MTYTIAVIPTKIQTHLFDKIISTLEKSEVDEVLVLNNGDRPLDYLDMNLITNYEDAQKMSIYQMWNRGFEYGKVGARPYNVLVLNDDVDFEPHLVSVLSMYLRRDPSIAIVFPDYDAQTDTGAYSIKYTETTAGAGGMSGFCFMIKGELGFRVDENLKLYWGDDDLVKQVTKAGYKIARVSGLPILHAGSYTIRRMDNYERRNLMESDRAYFNQKYGESREPVL